MIGSPRPLSDAELLEFGERAMRHAATIFDAFTGCRRRACRRNGCCGPMVGGGCLTLPDGRRIDGARIPACMTGIDPRIASGIKEQSRVFLELLLCNPSYNLHSARLRRTFGKDVREEGSGGHHR